MFASDTTWSINIANFSLQIELDLLEDYLHQIYHRERSEFIVFGLQPNERFVFGELDQVDRTITVLVESEANNYGYAIVPHGESFRFIISESGKIAENSSYRTVRFSISADTIDDLLYDAIWNGQPIAQEDITCIDGLPIRLGYGTEALVISENEVVIYDDPDISSPILRTFAPGTSILVSRGVQCSADGTTWWTYEDTSERIFGYVMESRNGEYLLGPAPPVPATSLQNAGNTCTIASRTNPPQRLGPGIDFEALGLAQNPSTAIGQVIGTDGQIWFALENGTYVSSDEVTTEAACTQLPNVAPIPPTFNEEKPPEDFIPPVNRRGTPSLSELLNDGIGITDGIPQNNGEIQVEGYCTQLGYNSATETNQGWACTTSSGIAFELDVIHYDLICRETYSNPRAFAVQDGDSNVPAFQWRCYEGIVN